MDIIVFVFKFQKVKNVEQTLREKENVNYLTTKERFHGAFWGFCLISSNQIQFMSKTRYMTNESTKPLQQMK